MATWSGHGLTITIALSQILERASSNAAELRREERVIYTAAEFWAAVSAQELVSHLKRDPERQLLAAGVAFTEMGASHVGGKLRRAHHRLRTTPASRLKMQELFEDLERELIATDDPVEQLLAARAAKYIRDTSEIRRAENN
jgi:hypothetical protein